MKHNVKLSTFSIVTTTLFIFVMAALSVYGYRGGMPQWLAYGIAGLLIVMIIMAFFYMPLNISVTDNCLKINFILRRKSIPLKDIESAMLCPPTMAEHKICGSGGFFGYWGWFYEASIGRYFAYYGKASDCFLVKMKSGRQYLLGCENPAPIVDAINSKR